MTFVETWFHIKIYTGPLHIWSFSFYNPFDLWHDPFSDAFRISGAYDCGVQAWWCRMQPTRSFSTRTRLPDTTFARGFFSTSSALCLSTTWFFLCRLRPVSDSSCTQVQYPNSVPAFSRTFPSVVCNVDAPYSDGCTVVSDSLPLHFGVPQGSVLGPKRFIEYTEDVDDLFVRHSMRHHLFADDMPFGGRVVQVRRQQTLAGHLCMLVNDQWVTCGRAGTAWTRSSAWSATSVSLAGRETHGRVIVYGPRAFLPV